MIASDPIDRAALIRRWRLARYAFYVGLTAWFALVAFYVGPNWLLFRKLTWITPADFAETARLEVVPVILAIRAYEADHGYLPDSAVIRDSLSTALEPYLPADREWRLFYSDVREGKLYYWTKRNFAVIVYELDGNRANWRVGGPFTAGPLDLAAVEFDPSAPRPATRPTRRK